MINSAYRSALVALVGAVVLVASRFGLALDGAGAYQSLPEVRLGIFVGALLAYFVALWVALRICPRVQGISGDSRRYAIVFILSVVAGFATFLAPLIPSAALAAICLGASLCPHAANPVLWSWLKLVTDMPLLPILVGISAVFCTVLWSSRQGGANTG